MIDEGFNLSFEVTWQEVVFKQNAVFQGLLSTFDLALGLRMIRCPRESASCLCRATIGKFARDVAGSVFAVQMRLMDDVALIAT